jgi:hypothetical protein
MNRPNIALALVSFTLFSAAAFADDSMTRTTPTDEQLIKTCIEKQKTGNVTMSHAEMDRYCRSELKRQKVTGELPEKPPVDTPHEDSPPQ